MVDDTPKVADGFTRIANELMDAILQFGFSKRQLHVVIFVIRKTYGWGGNRFDYITSEEIARNTCFDASNVRKTINELVALNVIKREGRCLGINNRIEEWRARQNDQKRLVDE